MLDVFMLWTLVFVVLLLAATWWVFRDDPGDGDDE